MFKSTRHILAVIVLAMLNACAIFGDPTVFDETKEWNAQRLYAEADLKMRTRDYDKAIDYFKALETRYPHGKYAAQAQLETAYAYYKKNDSANTLASADRFIKLHPNHPNLDYAFYLKGLASFNERGIVERITKQQISDRDPKLLRESFLAFKDLNTRFPESRYAKDTVLRMTYLANALAENELHVARYYMKRAAYVAAVNRCKYVLENFPDSPSKEEALVITVSAYDALGYEDLKNDTLRILKLNYPNSQVLNGKAPEDEKVWWKFWEAL